MASNLTDGQISDASFTGSPGARVSLVIEHAVQSSGSREQRRGSLLGRRSTAHGTAVAAVRHDRFENAQRPAGAGRNHVGVSAEPDRRQDARGKAAIHHRWFSAELGQSDHARGEIGKPPPHLSLTHHSSREDTIRTP
ncbi:hypothetical protein MMC07_006170 [Pseudocyphellaria aurata]|nr:hypothetical protein [Pseudocyphellaria aurata]